MLFRLKVWLANKETKTNPKTKTKTKKKTKILRLSDLESISNSCNILKMLTSPCHGRSRIKLVDLRRRSTELLAPVDPGCSMILFLLEEECDISFRDFSVSRIFSFF